ncbi:uncharacterized protein LOC129596983 isoform X2 [Paramacrobiotus metropolitanus]|nr:uncharacterized protein LOC129596983 isoform X2 [Paramacrobiotus metropolitanus]XP_055350364.1 uncharacterized protein LOC129596983 isoform X2 [Paramacrobiotus metropolitanus]XP_055350365.1 uncharacterized protein LOC129596983 isoform X2 [Paramacrobiotus metropolitanus]
MSWCQTILADTNQVSCRNTVAVRNPDDIWWLGYIQDINGDHAFIHFNSTVVHARWIHMKDIWPLPSYFDSDIYRREGYENTKIFAALRDEYNGPFRMRPAIILHRLPGCSPCCWMFYIRTDGSGNDVPAQKKYVDLVHESQVASEMPPSGPSLLDRRSGFLYTKHFIPFHHAKEVFREPSDKFRIVLHMSDDLGPKMNVKHEYLTSCCRFHLRTEPEGCIFVIGSLGTDAELMRGMATTLTKILETHLASRADLPSINNRIFSESERTLGEADIEVNGLLRPSVPAVCVRDLTPSLMSDILSHLDLHSQMRAKRVCVLWQLLLKSSSMMEHVSISFESCWRLKVDTDNCFKAASLLSRSLSSATICLTVLNVFPPERGFFLGSMLDALEIELPFLMFKNFINVKPRGAFQEKKSRLKHGMAEHLTPYKHYCKFLLLQNWKVSDLFGQQMYAVFSKQVVCHHHEPFPGVTSLPLPAHEQEWMVRLTSQPLELAIDKLQITIPKLLLRCSDGKMHMASRLMCALNDNFPPVTEDMLAKVMAVHVRWQRTLTYPEDWQRIRNYLLMFSGFHPDGRPKVWDDVDLRVVDVRTWSKMAIYGIHEVFRL